MRNAAHIRAIRLGKR
jgi:hypothetical protein